MNEPPVVVVLGEADHPPPGIDAAESYVVLRYASDVEQLASTEPEAVYVWNGDPGPLEGAWSRLERLRWIQTASAGVDDLLFPQLVASEVVVTNTHRVFDRPIAE